VSTQDEVVDRVLEILDDAGVLEQLIIVGSWCTYFYRHHFGESFRVSPLRTLDIDIDVSLLKRARNKADVPRLLAPLGFDILHHNDGSMSLVHPAIKIEFLVPEKGRGADGPLLLRNFRITAQPLRFLSLLEEEVLIVEYRGMKVNVPSPAHFALHKLIISQRRMAKTEKPLRDIRQALEVLDMLYRRGEESKVTELAAMLTKKQKGYVTQALQKVSERERVEFEALASFFKECGGR
jgi:hypothetical protein